MALVELGSGTLFPRLQKRGPIEASGRVLFCLTYDLFPRLQKRGPIEAHFDPTTGERRLCFHAYKSVAPLKRSRVRRVRRDGRRFPRLQKRGPIEAARPVDRHQRAEYVSTLTKAWPH